MRRGCPLKGLSRWLGIALVGLLAPVGCRKARPPPPPPVAAPRSLSLAQVVRLFPEELSDADGWGRDLLRAFSTAGIVADTEHVCGAVAILRQESGFQVDPPVPGLAEMVRKRLDELSGTLGAPGKSAVQTLLAQRRAGDSRTFAQRLRTLHTERDLDLLFRDMLAAAHSRHPVVYRAANVLDAVFRRAQLEDLNPVGTAGSMQVGARWVLNHTHGEFADADAVRDVLFTRAGGLQWGVLRLWGYPAHYPRPLFRFADYNAGEYASRNAAVQRALSRLTGESLAADGDLLAYDVQGKPKGEDSASLHALLAFAKDVVGLSPVDVRRDVLLEKRTEFEGSPTYRALQVAYRARFGVPLSTGELPDLELTSPKLKSEYSTARYARAVNAHFQACVAKALAGA